LAEGLVATCPRRSLCWLAREHSDAAGALPQRGGVHLLHFRAGYRRVPITNVRHFCDGSGHDPVIARNHGDADGAGRGIP